jgi:hypothetical protein
MSYTTDNRWISGQAPDNAPAAYGARWIDQGSTPFDVVPDRQGFAYNDAADRDRLIDLLTEVNPREFTHLPHGDEWQRVLNDDRFQVLLRRTGGYAYVEAWLT